MKNINDAINKCLYTDARVNYGFISVNKLNNNAFLWLSIDSLAGYLKVHRNTIIQRFKIFPLNSPKPPFLHLKNHDIYLISDINTFESFQQYLSSK